MTLRDVLDALVDADSAYRDWCEWLAASDPPTEPPIPPETLLGVAITALDYATVGSARTALQMAREVIFAETEARDIVAGGTMAETASAYGPFLRALAEYIRQSTPEAITPETDRLIADHASAN